MRKKKSETMEKQSNLQEEELIIQPVKETVDDGIIKGTVGYELRKAREKKKKDLTKIATQLRIRPSYLEALEKSQYNAFPGQAYAFGFLRTYSDFLGTDTENLILRYRDERAFMKPEKIQMPIPPEKTEILPTAKYLFWSILCIALIWSFWYFLTYVQPDTPPKIAVETASTQENKPQPVSVLPVEQKQEEKVEKLPATQTDSQAIQKTEPQLAQKTAIQPETKKNRIKIVAQKDIWIEVSEGDKLIFSKLLRKNESYDVPEKSEKMLLKTGNAGYTDVFVDGKKVKSLGPAGAIISDISLSPEKLKNR